MKAILALEDGSIFEGTSFGADAEAAGEVCFNTAITGYQEVLTDPSYCGQIVAMTYPLIGNYGINRQDVESARPQVWGFVVRERAARFSNWRAQMSLDEYLKRHRIPAIEGVDTRQLTCLLRTRGAMKGVLSTRDLDPKRLVRKAKNSPGLEGRDLVKEVTCAKPYRFKMTNADKAFLLKSPGSYGVRRMAYGEKRNALRTTHYALRSKERGFRVMAIDCGMKRNILRRLALLGCTVDVVPASTPADRILAARPDGVFLSNGPGDPAAVDYVVQTVRGLLGRVPIFGICLGHQMLGLALGARTFKLKFGHRGVNHPVKNLRTGQVEITSQNHGFCVQPEDLGTDVEITHLNLNDKTLEGFRHKKWPVFAVQYHPEASPGPHDAAYLFEEFIQLMKKSKGREA